MAVKNHTLYEVFLPLQNLNAAKLPPLVSLRIGRNLIALLPVIQTLEEKRVQLVKEFVVGNEHVGQDGYAERFKEFEAAWKIIMDDDSEWTPAITIPVKFIENAKEFAHTAQLYASGILVD